MEELQLPRDNRANAVQRRDPMAKIRVKCRTMNQVIPGGYVLPKGESICKVFKPDLPVIMDMVETEPHLIANAEKYYERAVFDDIKDELDDIPDEEGKKARLIRARVEHSGSVEGVFRFLEKRDIKPLESVEVLEDNIPAPVQAGQVEQNTFLATTIAREVAAALATALPQIIAAVQGGSSSTPAASTKQQR